jgi:hypothetical protein
MRVGQTVKCRRQAKEMRELNRRKGAEGRLRR